MMMKKQKMVVMEEVRNWTGFEVAKMQRPLRAMVLRLEVIQIPEMVGGLRALLELSLGCACRLS